MKLRILHTESSWGWGGQELRILTESVALAERGHQLCIAAAPNTPILQRALQLGLEGVALPIRKKTISGCRSIRQFLTGHRFDVVNTHSSTDSWLVAVAAATLAAPPTIVRTRHVSTEVRPGWSNRWLFGHATRTVVTTGDSVRNALIQGLGLSPLRVVSIPTGVSADTYRPIGPDAQALLRQRLGVPTQGLVIGTVATLRLLKGMNFLFAAIRLLQQAPVHLLVVGDGPQMESLQALLAELGIRDRVTMVGQQSNVHEWLQSMDIFVFPSLAEGVPQALAQAMLTALPCVTTDVGGIPELAIHLQTAWVCPPRNAAALARGIEAVVSDTELRARLGRQARQHCIRTRSIEQMADAMEKVFYEAIDSRT